MPKLSRSAQPPHTAPEDIRVGHNTLSRTDQLEYLADLTLELKNIAENLGCTALAGILLMAYREAVMQAQRR